MIHLVAPLAVLRERDPHGLYARAADGATVAVPGLSSPYEPPVRPSLRLDTAAESLHASGGRILEVLLPKIGITVPPADVAPTTRQRRGCCVWLTGLSGAGKSTIAEALVAGVEARGHEVTFLDGDVVRTHLSRGLGFSRDDRDANVRHIGFVAGEVVRHGGVAICAAISPYEGARQACRAMIGADRFVLVYVNTPLAVCERRDPKAMYARARRGEIHGFTGIDDPYEPPLEPDLVLSTTDTTPDESARLILAHLEARGLLVAGAGR